MAARLRPHIQEEVRAKIKVVQILNFLEAYAITGKDTGGHEDVNPARIQAARILLDKSIPSLQAMELSGDVEYRYVMRLPDVLDQSEWQRLYAPKTLPAPK